MSRLYAPWVAQFGLQHPYGRCQCGCGQATELAKYSDNRRLTLKGQPQRFLANHSARVLSERKYHTLQEAFAGQVAMGTKEECWDANSLYGSGYGRVMYEGRSLYAHRVAYELFKGVIRKGGLVCHKCDRPSCANPDHLFVGSNQDNMTDMVAKGRQAKGEGHASYKHGRYVGLSREQVKRLYFHSRYNARRKPPGAAGGGANGKRRAR